MNYYKSTVKVQSDGKSVNQELLVYSDSMFYTEEQINRYYDGTSLEFETISISKTKIVDVIDNDGVRKYKVILKSTNEDGKEFKTEHVVCADDIDVAKSKTQDYAPDGCQISLISETKIVEIIQG